MKLDSVHIISVQPHMKLDCGWVCIKKQCVAIINNDFTYIHCYQDSLAVLLYSPSMQAKQALSGVMLVIQLKEQLLFRSGADCGCMINDVQLVQAGYLVSHPCRFKNQWFDFQLLLAVMPAGIKLHLSKVGLWNH